MARLNNGWPIFVGSGKLANGSSASTAIWYWPTGRPDRTEVEQFRVRGVHARHARHRRGHTPRAARRQRAAVVAAAWAPADTCDVAQAHSAAGRGVHRRRAGPAGLWRKLQAADDSRP